MIRLLRVLLACCTLLGFCLLVISYTPFVGWMARDIGADWYDGDGDVLIVLGGSMLVDGIGPQATMGYDSYLRCTYASWILQQHHYRYVIVSGSDGLGQAMARYLINRGLNSEQVLIEDSAHTTLQNAEFSSNILKRVKGLPAQPRLVILTSDYHSRRAQRTFEDAGIKARIIPVPDVAKRVSFIEQRWDAFVTLSDEWVKTMFYGIEGKI